MLVGMDRERVFGRLEVYLAYLDYKLTHVEMMRDSNDDATQEVGRELRTVENVFEQLGYFQKPKPIVESLKSMFDELIGPNRRKNKPSGMNERESYIETLDSEPKPLGRFSSPGIHPQTASFQTFRGATDPKDKENIPPPAGSSTHNISIQTSERSKFNSNQSEGIPKLVSATDLPNKRTELFQDGLVYEQDNRRLSSKQTLDQQQIFERLGLTKPSQSPTVTTVTRDIQFDAQAKSPSPFPNLAPVHLPSHPPNRNAPTLPAHPIFKQTLQLPEHDTQLQDYSQRVEALMSLLISQSED